MQKKKQLLFFYTVDKHSYVTEYKTKNFIRNIIKTISIQNYKCLIKYFNKINIKYVTVYLKRHNSNVTKS